MERNFYKFVFDEHKLKWVINNPLLLKELRRILIFAPLKKLEKKIVPIFVLCRAVSVDYAILWQRKTKIVFTRLMTRKSLPNKKVYK